jgi:hypothetical protein
LRFSGSLSAKKNPRGKGGGTSLVGWVDAKWNQIRHNLIAMSKIVVAAKQHQTQPLRG